MKCKEPEWTAENMNRESGSTTLVTCGWCKYMSSGSCRYNCYLSGSCSLLKSYDRDVEWDMPCTVKKLGAADIRSIVENKHWQIEEANRSIALCQQQIASLAEHGPDIDQPVLAKNRSHDHFNISDGVFVFHDGNWDAGVVVSGYRHHDGCVSYVLDDHPETDGKPWGGGFGGPWVMKKDEMEWFIGRGLDVFTSWLELQDVKYNGDTLPLSEYRNGFLRLSAASES